MHPTRNVKRRHLTFIRWRCIQGEVLELSLDLAVPISGQKMETLLSPPSYVRRLQVDFLPPHAETRNTYIKMQDSHLYLLNHQLSDQQQP